MEVNKKEKLKSLLNEKDYSNFILSISKFSMTNQLGLLDSAIKNYQNLINFKGNESDEDFNKEDIINEDEKISEKDFNKSLEFDYSTIYYK